MNAEVWKPVVGYEGTYEVSDLGRVRRVKNQRILKPRIGKRGGYLVLSLSLLGSVSTASVHILVARAFIGEPPDGMEVCHDDGDSKNPLLSNLRYGTKVDNAQDRFRHGTTGFGEKSPASKLTDEQVLEVRRRHSNGASQKELAAEFSVDQSNISHIVRRLTWAHI